MKIGIFAGTFDPVHSGHIAFAVKAVRETELDKVVIVAEKNPYRKKPFASWDHRQAMIERATQSIPEADHDYEFSNALAWQHTMKDMLTTAKKHYGQEHEFWFLVGSDLFEHMSKWHDVTEQHEYGGFIVALRDDHTKEWVEEKQMQAREAGLHVVVNLIENTALHVSSSRIRKAIQNGEFVKDLDEKVADYIASHALYLVK